jgi:hypothetical protein
VHLLAQIAAAGDVMRPRNTVGAALSRNFAIHYRFVFALADNFSYHLVEAAGPTTPHPARYRRAASIKDRHSVGTSASGKIALTGQAAMQTPQSTHTSGSITRCFPSSEMQSTGHAA